jgi:hypothetical protein
MGKPKEITVQSREAAYIDAAYGHKPSPQAILLTLTYVMMPDIWRIADHKIEAPGRFGLREVSKMDIQAGLAP